MSWSFKSTWTARFGLLLVFHALLQLGGAAFAEAQEAVRLALLPFENVSGSTKSAGIVMPMIEQILKEKGYRLVGQKELEPFLFRNRIRNTGMISRRHLAGLREAFGVRLAMVGSVDLFHESDEPEDTPQWGLSSRVLSTENGSILWAESAGFAGDDFTGILGLGRVRSVERLGRETVRLLLRNVPRAGEPFRAPEVAGPSFFRIRSFRAGYRSPKLQAQLPRRVAVLPFNNASERRGAGRILTDIFTTALVCDGRFEVMEPGEVNEALIALKTASYGAIDFESLSGLRNRIGVDAVILGTIYTYNEGIKPRAKTAPEVELDVRMLSAGSGEILWSALHGRAGTDYQIALDFGVVSSMVPLILKVVAEMLETL